VDEIKTNFYSNITHEFRTPLSLILPPAEQMLREVEEPRHRRRLMIIERNAKQLLSLVNQLLDISKLESGNMQTAELQGDVVRFVGQSADAFRNAAEEKGILLHYKSLETNEEWLFDVDKWSKIINNLLSNALKFTPTGGEIKVALNVKNLPPASASITDSKYTAILTVQDTGIGIPADKLVHIFDRFYQVDNSQTRAFGGTGIGLSLVKELVQLLNGRIKVDSKPGEGTLFTVEFPIEKAKSNPDVPKYQLPDLNTAVSDLHTLKADLSKCDHKQTHVTDAPLLLVIDDNTDLREFIAGELSDMYRVLTAANGEQGWALVRQELPDIVISDIMMPELDGHALTVHIKTNPLTNHIPIILLTAKTTQQSKIAGLAQGADDYLAKPFHLQELKLRLCNMLNHQQKLRHHYHQQLTNPQLKSPTDKVEDKFLRLIYEAIEKQLDNTEFDVDALATAVMTSRRTLYRKLDTLTGLTPNEAIHSYRLLRATQLLTSGYSVSEAAYMVGFESPSYFGHCFKRQYKATPSEYQQRHLAQS
jgi:DNA-binding response OmpR family regulator